MKHFSLSLSLSLSLFLVFILFLFFYFFGGALFLFVRVQINVKYVSILPLKAEPARVGRTARLEVTLSISLSKDSFDRSVPFC